MLVVVGIACERRAPGAAVAMARARFRPNGSSQTQISDLVVEIRHPEKPGFSGADPQDPPRHRWRSRPYPNDVPDSRRPSSRGDTAHPMRASVCRRRGEMIRWRHNVIIYRAGENRSRDGTWNPFFFFFEFAEHLADVPDAEADSERHTEAKTAVDGLIFESGAGDVTHVLT